VRTIIDYARRKYRDEQWPMAPALQPVREALERMFPSKAHTPAAAETACTEPLNFRRNVGVKPYCKVFGESFRRLSNPSDFRLT
jgi:hypothetical protein